MHIKHLKRGTGSGKAAASYLTQTHDSTGKRRDAVLILRGDPHQVAAVADSLTFKHKYTSGVISWAPEDRPTADQIRAVVADYEKIAFAGLSPDRYAFSAVLHDEKDKGVHVHTFTARVDLATGKSLNIAPPGHTKTFDTVRDYHNHTHGWARPDDPARARMVQPGFHAYVDAAKLRAGLQVEPDPRQLVTDYLTQRVRSGEIENRDDVLTALHEAGLETPRAGKNYITVLDPETGDKFRLKGTLYNADFQRERFENEIEREDGARPAPDRKPDPRAAAAAYEEFENQCQRRAAFNQKKYGAGLQKPAERDPERDPGDRSGGGFERDPDADRKYDQQLEQYQNDIDQNLSVDHRLSSGPGRDHGRGAVQPDVVLGQSDSDSQGPDGPGRGNFDFVTTESVGVDAEREREREMDTPTPGDNRGRDRIHDQQRAATSSVTDKKGINHGTDRTGTNIDQHAAAITAAADRNNQQLAAANKELERSSARVDRCLQQVSPRVLQRAGEQRMSDELSKFKREINLVEYAASHGFEKDKDKSGKSTIIMRSGEHQTGEKIGIFVGRGGDQMFHNFRNGKSGSVIDFCQQQTGKNLGHVRQDLRSYLGSPAPAVRHAAPRPKPSPQAQAKAMEKEKASVRPMTDTAYLESRGISRRTLQDPRFGNIMQDARGNVCFPHYNNNGVSGYEKKNDQFTGFSPGGEKGAYFSKMPENCNKIVVCESGIDALSHAELHPDNNAAYISIAGQMSPEQEQLLKDVIERNSDKTFVAGFDNDPAGQRFADDLQKMCSEKSVAMETDLPRAEGRDWNDEIEQYQNSVESLKGLCAAYRDAINEYDPESIREPPASSGGLIEEVQQLKQDAQNLEDLLDVYQQAEQEQDRGPSL
jgi:hypothetical protein